MIRVDLKLVHEYINGNDIEYDIDELEDNKSFMKLVLKFTKDKKMFNYCSDNLKNDLSFIDDVANIFSDDEYFIYEIIGNFIKNNKDNPLERMEGALLAQKYLKDQDLVVEFKALANVLYLVTSSELAKIMEDEKDDHIKNELGMGFAILKESYVGYPLSTEFCAKKVLDDIFDEIPNLEVYLHKLYKDVNSLLKYGLCNFIVSLVSIKDQELANYIMINPNVTTSIKKRLERYVKNWNNFEKNNRLNKIEVIYSKIIEYLLDNNIFTYIDLDLFVYYVLHKFGIEKEVFLFDTMVDEEKFKKMLNCIESGIINESMFTQEELKHASAIEKIVNDVISQRIYEEDEEKMSNVIVFKLKQDFNNN